MYRRQPGARDIVMFSPAASGEVPCAAMKLYASVTKFHAAMKRGNVFLFISLS